MNTYTPITINPEDVTAEHLYDFLLTIKEFSHFDQKQQQYYFITHVTEYETYKVWFDMRYMGYNNCCLLGLFIRLNHLPTLYNAELQPVCNYFTKIKEDLILKAFYTYSDDDYSDFAYHLNRSLTILKFYIAAKHVQKLIEK